MQQLRDRIFIGLFSDHGFYYNPNIYPDEEYLHRVKEQQHLICQIPQKYPVSFLEGDFDKERFYDMAKGLEKIPEGGERCFQCYRLRLEKTGTACKGTWI